MYDGSDRFLHQLAADRRESLLRSGRRAPTKHPFRRALAAGLVRLGLGVRPALGNSEETCRIQENPAGSAPSDGERSAADVVSPCAGASTTRLRHGAQQA